MSPPSDPLIRVRGLRKTYRSRDGGEVVALEGIAFDLAPGELVSVVGPSGCGKTTLLKILAGLSRPSGGEALLDGRPIEGPRRDIGVVFQSPVLLPWRTVMENTLLPLEVHRLPIAAYAARARELVELVGLSGFEGRYPFELSGGMQQRNSIIRALIHDPKILLMDEPFGALDAMTREQMNLMLQDLWLRARTTIIFITHSIAEAVFLADRVVVMSPRPGRIVDVLAVPLPRPRGLDLMADPRFGELVTRIRRALDAGPFATAAGRP